MLLDSSTKRLYYLLLKQPFTVKHNLNIGFVSKGIKDARLWNLRLGHLPFNNLMYILPDLDTQTTEGEFLCTICTLAKQARISFNKSLIRTVKAFLLVHVDIWEALRAPTRTKCTMFITIVDDFTRYTWIFLIKKKFDFLSCFKSFYSYVETHIKTMRMDNANELSQGETLCFYNEKGI